MAVIATRAHTARATLFHQTALLIDPANYRAANELGVLLAKSGQWQYARTYLLHSLTVRQFLGKRLNPADDIWVRDLDIILVPKHPIQIADEIINMVFTQGIYGVIPNQGISFAFSKASTL